MTVIIIEGIKDEISEYIFKSIKYTLCNKYYISYIEMKGLKISLINPNFNGITPNELKCREYFIRISKSSNIIMINDIEYSREEYYTEEYTTNTKYIIIIQETKDIPYDTEFNSICVNNNNTVYYKNYKEKLFILINNIKRNLINHKNIKVISKLYLLTKFTNLKVINTGYNIYYKDDTDILYSINDILIQLKNKYVLYMYNNINITRVVQMYNIVNIIQVKGKYNIRHNNINITEIDRKTEISEVIDIIIRLEKVLLIGDITTIKRIIKYINKDNADIKVSNNTLIKITVNGAKVIEKRYEIR
ncbi:hypothetical protein NEPAR06_2468 [Nematocida parisii]|nr:hypothetical protein NEPAR07_2438 [Nematocida parisii]KAI5157522.1 hypothetical protein NEPAR06_2468 [Nematocida parisii]